MWAQYVWVILLLWAVGVFNVLAETTLTACTFDLDACQFTQDQTDNGDWLRRNATSLSGPRSGNGGSGYFMHLDTASPRVSGDIARLYSPTVIFSQSGCGYVNFWYYANGNDLGKFQLKLQTDTLQGFHTLLNLTVPPFPGWKSMTVTINTRAPVKLVFEASVGDGLDGYFAIDDIAVISMDLCVGIPDTNIVPDSYSMLCTFDSDWCGFTVRTSDITWKRTNGSTPTFGTGPFKGYGGSGFYVYSEGTGGKYQSKTKLESPAIYLATGCAKLSFVYNMYGASIGELRVYKLFSDGSMEDIQTYSPGFSVNSAWRDSGTFNIKTSVILKIGFEGARGVTDAGDIALDNIKIEEQPTCNLNTKTPQGNNEMELVTTPGVINSLNYPNLYPNDYGHIWNITVAKGLKIEITFTALALEKCCDYVEIGEELYTGYNIPSPIDTNSSSVLVTFVTDKSVSQSGFQFQWRTYGEPITQRIPQYGDGRSNFPGWVLGIAGGVVVLAIILLCLLKFLWKRHKKLKAKKKAEKLSQYAKPARPATARPATARPRTQMTNNGQLRPKTALPPIRRSEDDYEQFDEDFEKFKAETRRAVKQQFDQNLDVDKDNEGDDTVKHDDGGDSLSDEDDDHVNKTEGLPGVVERAPRPTSARPKSGGARPRSGRSNSQNAISPLPDNQYSRTGSADHSRATTPDSDRKQNEEHIYTSLLPSSTPRRLSTVSPKQERNSLEQDIDDILNVGRLPTVKSLPAMGRLSPLNREKLNPLKPIRGGPIPPPRRYADDDVEQGNPYNPYASNTPSILVEDSEPRLMPPRRLSPLKLESTDL